MSQIATKRSSDVVPPAQSSIKLDTGNGYGSGPGTNVRRFVNIVYNVGTDITYADTAGDGGTFTINTDGNYSVSYSDFGASSEIFGVTVNSSGLGTAILSLPALEIVMTTTTQTNASFPSNMSATVWFSAGDVVRCQSQTASLTGNDNRTQFILTKIN